MAKTKKSIYYRTLLKGADCTAKQFFSETSLSKSKSAKKVVSKAAKSYIKSTLLELPFMYTLFDKQTMQKVEFGYFNDVADEHMHIYDYLKRSCENVEFVSQAQKHELIENTSLLIQRFLEFQRSIDALQLQEGFKDTLSIQGLDIEVACDYICERDGVVDIITIKNTSPEYSPKARKPENHPSSSVELLLLYKLGKSRFPNARINPSIYYLQGRKDVSNEPLIPFEANPSNNIISHIFQGTDTLAVDTLNALIEKHKGLSRKTIGSLDCKLEYTCKTCSFYNICAMENIPNPELEERDTQEEKVASGGRVSLTDPQTEAIMFDDGIARINAGAGSGKTTVIALRVVRLIKGGVDPQSILLVTFSNKGAQEMREKVGYWLSKFKLDVDVSSIKIVTFNAWGSEVVNKNYSFLGFTKFPRLAEKIDLYDILIEVLDSYPLLEKLNYSNPLLNLPNAKGAVIELSHIFSVIKSNLLHSVEKIQEAFPKFEEDAATLFEMYKDFNKKLVRKNLLQHQDQLNLVLELMDVCPRSIPSYQHIMIDEFQDSDAIQLEIVRYLINSPTCQSLMVVGDDAQSIYGFRYTSPENIINFDKMFPNVKDIVLPDNFRSTPEIVELANVINDMNLNKIDKSLISRMSHSGISPVFQEYDSSADELAAIVTNIKKDLKTSSPEDIAIITKTKDELIQLRNALTRAGIPCIIDIPEVLSKNHTLKLFVGFAEFLLDPTFNHGFLYYMLLSDFNGTMKLTKSKLEKVLEDAPKFAENFLALNTEGQLAYFFDLFKTIAAGNLPLEKLIEHIESKNFTDVTCVVEYLKKYVLYEDDTSFELDGKYKAVNLLTAHSSKGKEYSKVYVSINKFKNHSFNDVEETRRLFFVGITRAKKELVIYCNASNAKVNKEVKEDVVKAIDSGTLKRSAC